MAILLAETLITLGASLQRWCQGQEAWVPPLGRGGSRTLGVVQRGGEGSGGYRDGLLLCTTSLLIDHRAPHYY